MSNENETALKVCDIAHDVLAEMFTEIIIRFKDKVNSEVPEADDAHYGSGLMTLAVNFSGNILSHISKTLEFVDSENLIHVFVEALHEGIKIVKTEKSLH